MINAVSMEYFLFKLYQNFMLWIYRRRFASSHIVKDVLVACMMVIVWLRRLFWRRRRILYVVSPFAFYSEAFGALILPCRCICCDRNSFSVRCAVLCL